jgi:hypothetical protein
MKFYQTLKRDNFMISMDKRVSKMVDLQVEVGVLEIYFKCLEEDKDKLVQKKENKNLWNYQ